MTPVFIKNQMTLLFFFKGSAISSNDCTSSLLVLPNFLFGGYSPIQAYSFLSDKKAIPKQMILNQPFLLAALSNQILEASRCYHTKSLPQMFPS